MTAKRSLRSKRLVIDASVAHAAGGKEAIFPTSKYCREFLLAVLSICHRMVVTPSISDEWNRHQSYFARTWRVSMVARKKIVNLPDIENETLRNRVESASPSEYAQNAMLKDMRLIEAAIETDLTVVSLDNEARDLFHKCVHRVGELRNIVWVNPAAPEESPVRWLESGAKPDKQRRLVNKASAD